MHGIFSTGLRLLSLQMLFVFLLFGVSSAYITSIHVPAVLGNTNTGVISKIQLNITSGNGTVKILGPDSVGHSTLLSAETGVYYASKFTKSNESKFNFTYTIYDNFSNVTGPSGGLALTLLAISGIKQVPLNQNFTLTGTISTNGQVGEIGGITDKVAAAKAFGLKYVLAPAAPNQSFEDMLYYISQQINNIPVIEVSNVSQAVPYAFTNSTPIISSLIYNSSLSTYHLQGISSPPFSCFGSCNASYFNNLVNYTFAITKQEINSIPNNFSAVKSSYLTALSNYESIANKGYLYTGADLAFLEYITAFTFANSNNYTLNNAQSLLNQVSSSCSSLVPPGISPQNYEYITSGEARQSWAEQNLLTAQTTLNNSQSTDDIVAAISTIGESSAWCAAASSLYTQAQYATINSQNTSAYQLSNKLKALDLKLLTEDKQYSSSMYYNAAMSDYNSSEYGGSLYSLYYLASVNSGAEPLNYSESMLVNTLNSTLYGIWPVEYANSAAFYANEAQLSNNKSIADNYLLSSYPLEVIASGISTLDRIISENITVSSGSNSSSINSTPNGINSVQEQQLMGLIGEEAQSITSLQESVSNMRFVIELIIVMVVVFLVALLYFIAKEFRMRKLLLTKKKRSHR